MILKKYNYVFFYDNDCINCISKNNDLYCNLEIHLSYETTKLELLKTFSIETTQWIYNGNELYFTRATQKLWNNNFHVSNIERDETFALQLHLIGFNLDEKLMERLKKTWIFTRILY